ncbi:hypothetical protein [Psychroflexus sp. ALD_RP9]|uniref:hypothetical protein n=1 Tax=Psychroflexus sp. ALD_RP9 TaxID=2777186 RepID=UPI001A8E1348|nr:hypothetical protein [Psychroflexus sp. ALD_RP9]QSS97603.1 hypothetical protein IMZ30_02510 [Psychroflexus sp. ALD_RP9]
MNVRKLLKRTAIGLFASFFILVIILIVHIINVTPESIDNPTLQISRIDFESSLDRNTENQIKSQLKSLPAVKSWRINNDTGVLVFFYDNRYLQSQDIVSQIDKNTNLHPKLYKLSDSLAQRKVCPVDQNSFAYHFSKGVQRIFK